MMLGGGTLLRSSWSEHSNGKLYSGSLISTKMGETY